MKRPPRVALLPLTMIAFGSSSAFAQPLALIVNGGENAHSNQCDFYNDVDNARSLFQGWNQDLFVADGSQPGPSPAPNSMVCDDKGEPEYNANGTPLSMRRDVPGAHKADLGVVREQLKEQIKKLKPGDPVVFYFTDHGEPGAIRLWGNDLSIDEMRDLLKMIPPQNKAIEVFDSCFGGNFLDSAWGKDGKMLPNVCAVSAASPGELAPIGQSFMRQAAKSPSETFSSIAHDMTLDMKIDTVPASTSTRFLDKYAAAHDPVPDSLCATCIAEPSATASLDSTVANIAKTSLATELQSLQSDIKTTLQKLHIDPNATLAQIKAAIGAKQKRIQDADDFEAQASKQLATARLAYIKSKMGASYTQLKSLDAKLDHLREARDTATDPDAIAAIDKKIDLLMPQYNALTAQMNRIGLAVDTDSASFQRFAKATAGADYPADVFDKEDGASRGQAFDHAIEKPTDVLNSLLQRAAAFREMLQNNDVDAINNYLRLQECENTSFKASS